MPNATFTSRAEAIEYAQKHSCPVGMYVRPIDDGCKPTLWEVSTYAEYADEPYYMGKTLIWPDDDAEDF